MAVPLLKTKLYIPSVRSGLVPRLRLIERLNESREATIAFRQARVKSAHIHLRLSVGCHDLGSGM
jgi:hypothetical protein